MTPDHRQRIKALAAANEVRCGKAQIKREIDGMPFDRGMRRVIDIISDPQGYEGDLYIDELLTSVHYVGPSRALAWLQSIGMSATQARLAASARRDRGGMRVKVRDLTERQRAMLAVRLSDLVGERVAA